MAAILQVISLALRAYIVSVESGLDRELNQLEDEIYKCVDDGSPTAKLRLERLAARRQRKLSQLNSLRPADDPLEKRDGV